MSSRYFFFENVIFTKRSFLRGHLHVSVVQVTGSGYEKDRTPSHAL